MGLEIYRKNGSKDTLWTGPSSITGVFRINGVPQSREIFLLEMDGLTVRRKTFSDANGNYSFTGLPLGIRWLILYIDSNGVYNAVARSHVESQLPVNTATPTAWDTAFNTNITYSEFNRGVNSVHFNNSFTKTLFSASTGKYYLEMTSLSIYSMVGIIPSNLNKTNTHLGVGASEIAIFAYNGDIYNNNIVIGSEAGNYPISTIGIYLDCDDRSVKFITNTNNSNTTSYGPLPGSGPISVAWSSGASTTSSGLLNSGQLPFVYTKPNDANGIFG